MGEANGAIKVVNERMRAFFDLDCEIEGLTIAKLGRAIATATPMSEREAAAFTAVWEAQLASDTPRPSPRRCRTGSTTSAASRARGAASCWWSRT